MPNTHSAFDASVAAVPPIAIKGLTVATVILKPGEVTHTLETVHGFGISPDHATVTPAGINGARFKDVQWDPGSIGHLPPGLEISAAMLDDSQATYITIPDEMFKGAAFETIDVSRIERRWTPNIVDPVITNLLGSLKSASHLGGIGEWPMLAESIATAVAVRTVQNLGAVPKCDAPYARGLPKDRLKRVIDYVDTNLHRPMNLSELAGVAVLSTFHFSRAFKASMNIAPVRYVWRRRVERAKIQLRHTVEPLVVIAYACGFSSQSHFTTLFKEFVGVTPARFRAKLAAWLAGSWPAWELAEAMLVVH